MGRPSKLTDRQWEAIGKRLLSGESAASLSREFGVSKAVISQRFSKRIQTVKDTANQLVAADMSMAKLNVSEQIAARSLADELIQISMHLASTAKYNAATSHRLAGIANNKVLEIDDAAPLNDESRAALKDVGVLVNMANMASEIPINLFKANKEAVDAISKRDESDKKPKTLSDFYGDNE